MKEQVTILIPLFGSDFTANEVASLRSCNKHLNSFPITFIKAESNHNLDQAQGLCPTADFVSFDDRYFTNRHNYTKLLLSEEIYSQFGWSKYLLINNLTSEISKNELAYWCRQGFDYIQGPSPGIEHETFQDRIAKRLSTGKYLQNKISILASYEANNGFSLRLVEGCWNFIRKNKRAINSFLSNRKEASNDSLFWEYYTNKWWPQLNTPNDIARSRFIQLESKKESPRPGHEPFAIAQSITKGTTLT